MYTVTKNKAILTLSWGTCSLDEDENIDKSFGCGLKIYTSQTLNSIHGCFMAALQISQYKTPIRSTNDLLTGLHLVSRLLQASCDKWLPHEVLLLPQGEGLWRQVQKQEGIAMDIWINMWENVNNVNLRNASGADSRPAWRLGWRSSGC